MTDEPHHLDLLRERVRDEGDILWLSPGRLGIFAPDVAAQVNRDNFADLKLTEPPLRILLGNRGAKPVYWRDVRAGLAPTIAELAAPPALAALYERMAREALADGGDQIDLTLWTHRVVSRSQLPNVIATSRDAERRAIERDQDMKIRDLADPEAVDREWFAHQRALMAQVLAGRAIRRELHRRRAGLAAPCADIAQGILGMYDVLGAGRAAYLVGTFLTAIAGPPGSTASCMLFELLTRPEWREQVERECRAVSADALCENPHRAVPTTLSFVRETLRRWGFPPVVPRRAERALTAGTFSLAEGETYVNSAYVMHRDPRSWEDPDSFDPGRWSAGGCPRRADAFVPFGFGPRSCMGASLGLSQLILLCHLATTRLRVEPSDLPRARIRMLTAAMPIDFRGMVAARG